MKICHISAVMLLRRSDKQPDRVEISPEQLSAASTHAEVWIVHRHQLPTNPHIAYLPRRPISLSHSIKSHNSEHWVSILKHVFLSGYIYYI